MHACTCERYISRSYSASTVNAMRFHKNPFMLVLKRRQKGLSVSNLEFLLVVFKWHPGSEGVKALMPTVSKIVEGGRVCAGARERTCVCVYYLITDRTSRCQVRTIQWSVLVDAISPAEAAKFELTFTRETKAVRVSVLCWINWTAWLHTRFIQSCSLESCPRNVSTYPPPQTRTWISVE